MIDAGDRLAIMELLGLYGHIIDERQWDRMPEVFTDDVVYDPTDFDQPVTNSLAELAELWQRPDTPHPIAHHATNIVITETDTDSNVACVWSKGLGVGRGGRVGSVVYSDVVRRTGTGWRLSRRTATLRRAAETP
jgi:hypothetical protein